MFKLLKTSEKEKIVNAVRKRYVQRNRDGNDSTFLIRKISETMKQCV